MKRHKKKRWIVAICIVLFLVVSLIGTYGYCRMRFPLKYEVFVQKYAQEYQLDPYLVLAVIWAESSFRPEIHSRVGAMGLMQIMPSTAEFIASELKYTNLTVEDLKNPQVNIEFGCFYLSYLFDKYTETEKVLYAYNAGEGNLINYLVEFGEFSIKTIPIKETKNYIVRVKRAYNYYKKALKIRNLET